MKIEVDEKIELKCCPFCGSKVKLLIGAIKDGILKGNKMYKISCSNFMSNNYCIGSDITRWWDNKEECINAWNKRK